MSFTIGGPHDGSFHGGGAPPEAPDELELDDDQPDDDEVVPASTLDGYGTLMLTGWKLGSSSTGPCGSGLKGMGTQCFPSLPSLDAEDESSPGMAD